MSLPAEVKSTYLAEVQSDNLRYVVQPAAAVGVAAISGGAVAGWAWAPYVEICIAGVIADPSWLAGIHFHTNAVETFYGDIAIASGALGAEVDLAIIPVRSIFVGATAMTDHSVTDLPIYLPKFVRIAGTPRLAVRIRKDTAASAAGGVLKVILAEAIGA